MRTSQQQCCFPTTDPLGESTEGLKAGGVDARGAIFTPHSLEAERHACDAWYDSNVMLAETIRTSRTTHILGLGDARRMDAIPDESLHLVVTSPPYWTLKEYPDHKDQLGQIEDYEQFHDELEKVWKHCYRALV